MKMDLNKRLLLSIVLISLKTTHGLDKTWVDSLIGKSCKNVEYISIQNHSSSTAGVMCNDYTNEVKSCPPWYWPTGNGTCHFGNDLGGIVKSNPHSMQTVLENFYCMTTDPAANRTVVGECVYSNALDGFFPLPCNISELNNFMCAGLNREGQLCGKCREGFAPPAYSYSLKCVNCTEYSLNWLRYLAVAFVPLTIFCTFVVVFHISPTSPYLHGFIFFSHIWGMPVAVRLVIISQEYYRVSGSMQSLFLTPIGIWNLDFFRLVYEPFCIHPKITFLQTIALDYMVAAYPLVLTLFIYILVSLHSHKCKLVVVIWKPFKYILNPYVHNFNVHASLIDSFATLFYLSTLKFQSVSYDLLVPIPVFSMDGTHDHKYYLRLAGNVEYFGQEHLPYAILALSILLTLVVLPTLLLFLYPCQCFQQCLNKCHCNFLALRTFMDVFLGSYKDRTNSSKDFRYLAGIFFLFRTVVIILNATVHSVSSIVLIAIALALFAVSVALFQPHISSSHNTLDAFFLAYTSVGTLVVTICFANHFFTQLFTIVFVFTPMLYTTGLVLFWVVVKQRMPQAFFIKLCSHCCRQNANVPPVLNEQRLILPTK